MKTCPVCKTKFRLKYRLKNLPIEHCSRKCFWISKRKDFSCKTCGVKYTRAHSANNGYCSQECVQQIPCKVCGKTILGKSRMNGRLRVFCSRHCSAVFNRSANANNYQVVGFAHCIRRMGKLICERCKEDDTYCLCVHHKDRNRKNGSPENLETLCYNCHVKEHRTDMTKNRPDSIRKAFFLSQNWLAFFDGKNSRLLGGKIKIGRLGRPKKTLS